MSQKSNSSGGFPTQNQLIAIIFAVAAWYFTTLNDENKYLSNQDKAAYESQVKLMLELQTMAGQLDRVQKDIADIKMESRERSKDRYTRADHEAYVNGLDVRFKNYDSEIRNNREMLLQLEQRVEKLEVKKSDG